MRGKESHVTPPPDAGKADESAVATEHAADSHVASHHQCVSVVFVAGLYLLDSLYSVPGPQ